MNDYELESYLKTLFFYDDYKVTEIDYKKDNIFFVNRYNTDYVVAFKRVKKSFNIDKLINLRRVIKKQKVKQAIIVTNGVADNFVKSVISNEELLIDREKLEQKISEVYAKISLTTKKEDLIDKFDKNIQDKFPNMI